MKRRHLVLIALASAALTGCGSSGEDDGVGGVTQGEARALNEAAEMLDSRVDTTNQASATNESR
ncbi:hypothetical protein [Sphingobium subterraneum]|uniref:Lipoprotein n=1 Tax=Sphingobium subterraneum TaxID=627688 RepID=A0A841IYF3_9SPHN|nr:hypothetical protein [Sphingobium subterraneum]MBB6123162.1 hypothetical protein [Sphingobium subterraneum]